MRPSRVEFDLRRFNFPTFAGKILNFQQNKLISNQIVEFLAQKVNFNPNHEFLTKNNNFLLKKTSLSTKKN